MRDFAKAVLRLAAGLVLLFGLPAALIVAVGWPLPHTIPSLEEIGRAFDRRGVPVDVAINALAVIVWIAWAELAWAVLIEGVAAARGRQARQRVPALPSVQHFASQLVASLVLVVSVLGSMRSAGAAPHAGPPELIALEAVDQVPTPAPAQPAAPPTPGEYVVQHGDTYWGLAQQHLGDGTRWREIRDANVGRTVAPGQVITAQTDDLYPGWRLLLPATSAPPPAATEPPAAPTDPPVEVIVRAGDNLWSIAADQLAAQLGRTPTDAEITPYWRQLIDANIPRLTSGDPDLIYPAEDFILPAPVAQLVPVMPPPAQPAPPPVGAPSASPPTTTTFPPTTQPSPTTTVAPAAPTPQAPTPTAPSTTGALLMPDPDDELSGDADDPGPGPGLDVRVVGGSALFGGLVLAALARRRASRRRAARAGSTVPPVLEEEIDLEHACALTAGRTLEHAWAAARALGPALAALDDPPTITALVVGPGHAVTVHLDRPSAVCAPFRPGPVATTWIIDQTELDQAPGDRLVLDSLAAVCRTDDGAWVCMDLESLGTVEISGDPPRAERLIRSIVAELALQPSSRFLDLAVIGLDTLTPDVTEQGVLRLDRLNEDIVRDLERTIADTDQLLDTHELPTTAAARARGLASDSLYVTVLAVGEDPDSALLERVANAAAPGGRGAAVLSLTPTGVEATRLHVDTAGRLHVPHIGATGTAASLDRQQARRIDERLAAEPETPAARPRAATPSNEPTTPDPGPYQPPEWTHRVSIWADHVVHRPDGTTVSFRYGENPAASKNTRRGPELISYLAHSPDRSATGLDIAQHLWWDTPIATESVDKLLAGTRKILGGSDQLSLQTGDDRHYRLAATVLTDAELLTHAHQWAAAATPHRPADVLDVLRPHLQAIQAPPWRTGHLGQGLFSWACATRVYDQIEQVLIDVATLAADIAAGRGPQGLPEALRLLDQALTACPTNESLVRAAMGIEARLGNRDAINYRYKALAVRLTADQLEPDDETTQLRLRLTERNHRLG